MPRKIKHGTVNMYKPENINEKPITNIEVKSRCSNEDNNIA